MKKYIVEVWFRYVSNGEQEKDFEQYEIEANNFKEASNIALNNYSKNNNEIPFAVKDVTL